MAPPSNANIRPVQQVVRNWYVSYANDPKDFVAKIIAPSIPTPQSANAKGKRQRGVTYFTASQANNFGEKGRSLLMPPGTEFPVSRGVDFVPSTATCQGYGDSFYVSNDDLANDQLPVGLSIEKLTNIQNNLDIAREARLNTIITTATVGNYATLSGTDQWDQDGSDPLAQLYAGLEDRKKATGRWPNAVVFLGLLAKRRFLFNSNVASFRKYQVDRNNLSMAEASEFLIERLDVKRVIFASAVYNNANPGATQVQSSILGGTYGQVLLTTIPEDDQLVATSQGDGTLSINASGLVRFVQTDTELSEWDVPNRRGVASGIFESEVTVAGSPQDLYLLNAISQQT